MSLLLSPMMCSVSPSTAVKGGHICSAMCKFFAINESSNVIYGLPKQVNVMLGPEEERVMLSGLHTVEDIFCVCCGQILGWRYVIAHDKNQKYKEGKFVLERWNIEEDVAEEFSLDSRPGSSDADF
ncbi:hypothetical protein ACLB2K_025133 [Fragaria x ananassa]